MDDLSGRIALVTGGNHGIGAAIVRALVDRGAAVLLTYLRAAEPHPGMGEAYDAPRAAAPVALLEELRSEGAAVRAVEADLADAAMVPRLFDAAERELGPVDVLVHNASGWYGDTFSDRSVDGLGRPLVPVSAATIDRNFAVDARAGGLLIGEFARRHAARGGTDGRIVTLVSGGRDGFPDEVSYGAAKAALIDYTLSAATELAPLGVTANAVHPPVVDTGWLTPQTRAQLEGAGFRIAPAEEAAEVVAWLAGDGARGVSGTVVRMR